MLPVGPRQRHLRPQLVDQAQQEFGQKERLLRTLRLLLIAFACVRGPYRCPVRLRYPAQPDLNQIRFRGGPVQCPTLRHSRRHGLRSGSAGHTGGRVEQHRQLGWVYQIGPQPVAVFQFGRRVQGSFHRAFADLLGVRAFQSGIEEGRLQQKASQALGESVREVELHELGGVDSQQVGAQQQLNGDQQQRQRRIGDPDGDALPAAVKPQCVSDDEVKTEGAEQAQQAEQQQLMPGHQLQHMTERLRPQEVPQQCRQIEHFSGLALVRLLAQRPDGPRECGTESSLRNPSPLHGKT